MTDEEKQELLDAIKAESQSVDEIEEVTSLDGVDSLPAMKGESVVRAPLTLLSAPAEEAAAKAVTAATKAETAASGADTAAAKADTAAEDANEAAQEASDAALAANTAASKVDTAITENKELVTGAQEDIEANKKGVTVKFAGFIEAFDDDVTLNGSSDDEFDATNIYYVVANKKFYAENSGYFGTWEHSDLYNDETTDQLLKNKTYLCGEKLYAWSDDEGTLIEVSGSGSGSGFYNVTAQIPLTSGYYTLETAVAALADAKIDDADKLGMIITFETSSGAWADYRFISEDVTKLTDTAAWEEYGGGKVKSISLNNEAITPDASGNVNIAIDTISVDDSLQAESTNPVQNKAIVEKLKKYDEAIGDIDITSNDTENTMTIYDMDGNEKKTLTFTGGSGGGTSTSSKISLSSWLDKTTVKEGDSVTLTYEYDHLNADNESDGIKANITITIKIGTVTKFSQTYNNVDAGTYTLDISKYLAAGTMDIYVKAEATAEDGTAQTKQVYKSLTVVALKLTSGYNLASSFSTGGYRDGDTIEIPFSITGTGTKNISMYLDGAETPTTQTISKSGTSNGSFTISASSLASGIHSVQLVAERDGLLSDSIYITILKYGSDIAAVLVKLTDTTGEIVTGDNHLAPTIKGEQYAELTFNYAAYDPTGTPASVVISLDGSTTATVSVPRSQQEYSTRLTTQGSHTLAFTVGGLTYSYAVELEAGSTDVSETTYGLTAKLDATGRSNSESDPAVWTSGDIKTTFSGFDWSSNGWTGTALKLTNGAKAVISYQPFATDVKSTGLTFEVTMRVSNVIDRNSDVLTCLDNGKGVQITAEKAAFKTGQSTTYTDEDGNSGTRDVELKTNYVTDEWLKVCITIDTTANNRLMELYMNGNRAGADQYDTSFSFQQDTPQDITISSDGADVEIRSIRVYNRAITDDEELENYMVDSLSVTEMAELYEENDVIGEDGSIDIDAIRSRGKGVILIVRANKLTDVYATNNKKTDFVADVYWYSPYGSDYDFAVKNCYIRIQGTSSTKYPSKNIRIYLNKGTDDISMTIGGEAVEAGEKNKNFKYALRPDGIAMNLLCAKSDYSDSSMSMNTGGAKLFNDMMKELGLLTPPQQYQYEQGGEKTSAITVRTAIDGLPCDMFVAETADSAAEFVGQYNLNNEKSKSQDLFGMDGVEGYTPTLPICLETLNNTEPMCLFQSTEDEDFYEKNFDNGLELNYPDGLLWVTTDTEELLDDERKAAIKSLFTWIRDCKPTNATSGDISSWVSDKFKNELATYFDVGFLCCYYLFTDYEMAVDQRVKNMLLRTWDGVKWYIAYYDGDTKYGKRNDCFLVYDYTIDRDSYDSEAKKYAFEGRDSWLWNMLLANFEDELKTWAANMRATLTVEKVKAMYLDEQIGNWSDREYNKSGELKYIKPAIDGTLDADGNTVYWPFLYALQGSNKAHMEYIISNRFALLDAKYGTSSFQSDNIDFYLSRLATDAADVVGITGSEIYAYGYGTNNHSNIGSTGIVAADEETSIEIAEAYTVNDPLRLYGASRIKTLDMTGAASHLKNAFNLSKCVRLRTLLMNTTDTPSSSWWLTLDACTALQKIDLNGQANAKTGSSTSSELNFENQTRLEYLDARGTQVTSVNIADGAPVTTLMLPSTITTLRLVQLNKLEESGLTLESWDNVNTLIMEGCELLDWQTIAAKCASLKYVRVTDIDITDDGTLLDKYMSYKGVDENGNYTETCGLSGVVTLTCLADDDTVAAWQTHYPDLTIRNAEYSLIAFDDGESDPENVSNLDNKTGYMYGNDFVASGHAKMIRKKLIAVKGKLNTTTGVWEGEKISDADYTKLADGDDFDYKDSTDEGFDVFMRCPAFWYKGINDFKNQRKYIAWSGLESEPLSTAHNITRKTLSDIILQTNVAVITTSVVEGESTLDTSGVLTSTPNYNVYQLDVEGMKQVRWPGLNNSRIGAVFLDADGVIISAYNMAVSDTNFDFVEGDYIFIDVPSGAKSFVFTSSVNNNALEAIAVDSSEIEAIEPDWVYNEPWLGGVYQASVDSFLLLRSVSGATVKSGTGTSTTSAEWTYDDDGDPTNIPVSTMNYTGKDLQNLARRRGEGYQLFDYEMSKLMAILWMSLNGTRDAQLVCGYGKSAGGTTGYADSLGNSDSVRGSLSGVKCLGFESFFGCTWEFMDNVAVNVADYETFYKDACKDSNTTHPIDAKWHIYDPINKTERVVQGITTSGYCIGRVKHGRYCDVIASKYTSDNSAWAENYCDGQWYSASRGRVVGRSGIGSSAVGGLVYAIALHASSYSGVNYASSHASAVSGSRLAFRGTISISNE